MPILIIQAILAISLSLFPATVSYSAPESILMLLPQKAVQMTIPDLITQFAQEYDVSEELITKIVRCESSFRSDAIGDGGKSYGLVQIHQPSWPDITKEQAFDPEFAIEFLAKKLSEDKGELWTCYRKLK